MAAIRKILVPTDFSEGSRQALEYACMLSDLCGASLVVLHALETPYFTAGYMEVYAPPADLFERAEAAARAELDKAVSAERMAMSDIRLVLRIGSPAAELLAYLREDPDIDLIVMATHGRGGVARLMMGSVTDRLLRTAPCPVLTVREFTGARARIAGHAA